MIQIDLITGFLGSGKTTFLKKYARYWMSQGKRICILENDYGAVNVDMMLLQDLERDGCDLEMVAGGCDYDCHRRRFKTKLIAMGMLGYDRVLIEPSGVFDVDEFFDVLREEPLDRWYEIGNVIAIVNPLALADLSDQSRYLLASQTAEAGLIIYSRTQEASPLMIPEATTYLNEVMETVKCRRRFTAADTLTKPWDALTDEDMARIGRCGYKLASHVKLPVESDNQFDSVYFMNEPIPDPAAFARRVLDDPACGHVIRVKGFFQRDGVWQELNANASGITLSPLENGQQVVIVIGENLNEAVIRQLL